MNKPRLVDANKAFARYQRKLTRLIDKGEDRFSDECMKIRAIMSAIEEQPTAYDIDKVVEQMENNYFAPGKCVSFIGKSDAIEIVKKGGAE